MFRIAILAAVLFGLSACQTETALKSPCNGYGGKSLSLQMNNDCERTPFPR